MSNQNQKQGKAFEIFYSKDVRKKKKVYSEGILVCEEKKTKIFTTEGECILTINSRSTPQLEEQYTINNAYIGKMSYDIVQVERELPYDNFLNGRVFIQSKIEQLNLVKKPQKKK